MKFLVKDVKSNYLVEVEKTKNNLLEGVYGFSTSKGQYVNFPRLLTVSDEAFETDTLKMVDRFYNVKDSFELEQLNVEMNKRDCKCGVIYSLMGSSELRCNGDLSTSIYDLRHYHRNYNGDEVILLAYLENPVISVKRCIDSYLDFKKYRSYTELRNADVSYIYNYFSNKGVTVNYKQPINTIPDCLKGQYVLQNFPLFLVTSPNMQHCGFVYSGGQLHYLNTGKEIHKSSDNVVYYKLDGFKHTFTAEWVLSVHYDMFVPNKLAEKLDLDILVHEDEEMNINDGDLEYNRSVGYYNSNSHYVYDGDLYEIEESVVLKSTGERVPEDEARWCESKQGYYLKDDCVVTHDGDYELMTDCICIHGEWYLNDDQALYDCDDCSETCLIEEMNSTHEGYYLCNHCHENNYSRLNRKPYDTDVLDHKGFGETHFYINKKPIYVGLELETLVKDDHIDEVNNFSRDCNYAVATCDGSLDDALGLEYIFRPEGLEQQKRNVNDLYASLLGALDNESLSDYDHDYGLHVHVSSHFLSHVSKLKIQKFVSANSALFAKHIGKRKPTYYQKPSEIDFHKLDRDRYLMVNIQPSQTIEFRFPAGLIDNDHINLNLESALAVCLFCKFELNVMTLKKSANAAFKQFISYIEKNKKQFPLMAAIAPKLKEDIEKTEQNTNLAA